MSLILINRWVEILMILAFIGVTYYVFFKKPGKSESCAELEYKIDILKMKIDDYVYDITNDIPIHIESFMNCQYDLIDTYERLQVLKNLNKSNDF